MTLPIPDGVWRARRVDDCGLLCSPMSSKGDPRTEELGQLKLAMATFALHLDAFEMQALEVLHAVGRPGNDVPRMNIWPQASKG